MVLQHACSVAELQNVSGLACTSPICVLSHSLYQGIRQAAARHSCSESMCLKHFVSYRAGYRIV